MPHMRASASTFARRLMRRKFVRDTLILQAGKTITALLAIVSTIIVTRLLGPDQYGLFGLAQSLLILIHAIDVTGIGVSTSTRLAIAVGARDEREIHNLLAFYVQVSLALTLIVVAVAWLFAPALAQRIHGTAYVGTLAAVLSFTGIADALYGLVTITLQSRRQMTALALLQNANQAVLTFSLIGAVLIRPTAESVIIGRLVYSYATMALALIVYGRLRHQGDVAFPPMRAVIGHAGRVSPRPYWRFGVANALDRTLASIFVQLPMQIVGAVGGAHAAGYLQLALSGITQAGTLTSAVFDNVQAVVPQMVGRGDYAGLRRNFYRVLIALGVGAAAYYGAIALLAPLIIPPLFGAEWRSAAPAVVVLALYGAVTTLGGVFGPLYRALNLMRSAILVKLLALALIVPAGALFIQRLAGDLPAILMAFGASRWIPPDLARGSQVALGGAWMITLVFAASVLLTAAFTLPALRRRAITV